MRDEGPAKGRVDKDEEAKRHRWRQGQRWAEVRRRHLRGAIPRIESGGGRGRYAPDASTDYLIVDVREDYPMEYFSFIYEMDFKSPTFSRNQEVEGEWS